MKKGLDYMNTATLTFHASNNYGSFLQAYVLQKTLTGKMHIANTISDFRNDRQMRSIAYLEGRILWGTYCAMEFRRFTIGNYAPVSEGLKK